MITHLTTKTTSQELFDYITNFMFVQGVPSVDSAGSCLYRWKDGHMCAFGCVIPDEIYTPAMEGFSAKDLILPDKKLQGHLSLGPNARAFFRALEPHLILIKWLQSTHDSLIFSSARDQPTRDRYLIQEFTKIADRRNLKFVVPDFVKARNPSFSNFSNS